MKSIILPLFASLGIVAPSTIARAGDTLEVTIPEQNKKSPQFWYNGWKLDGKDTDQNWATAFVKDFQNAGWIGAFVARRDQAAVRLVQVGDDLYAHFATASTVDQDANDGFRLVLRRKTRDGYQWQVITIGSRVHEKKDCLTNESETICAEEALVESRFCSGSYMEWDLPNAHCISGPSYTALWLKKFPKNCTNTDTFADCKYSLDVKVHIDKTPSTAYAEVGAWHQEFSQIQAQTTFYFLLGTQVSPAMKKPLDSIKSKWVHLGPTPMTVVPGPPVKSAISGAIQTKMVDASFVLSNNVGSSLASGAVSVEIFARTFQSSPFMPNTGRDPRAWMALSRRTASRSDWKLKTQVSNLDVIPNNNKVTLRTAAFPVEYGFDLERQCYYRPCVYARIKSVAAGADANPVILSESVGYCFTVDADMPPCLD